jgi:hypothetical protein
LGFLTLVIFDFPEISIWQYLCLGSIEQYCYFLVMPVFLFTDCKAFSNSSVVTNVMHMISLNHTRYQCGLPGHSINPKGSFSAACHLARMLLIQLVKKMNLQRKIQRCDSPKI